MTVAGRLEGADPTDLEGLREVLGRADPEGKLAPIGMGRIEIGAEALSLLLEAVSELAMDATPMRRGGEVLKAPERLFGGSAVTYSTWTAPSTSATICCRKRRRRSASSKRGRTSST
ncbi:MAG: Iron-containing alcohol dehydrogenase [Rubrobacteraceae bacterium]|nr:Iron-containing alcohol dehydrogenase [Rubrobacteraceae bacterium]